MVKNKDMKKNYGLIMLVFCCLIGCTELEHAPDGKTNGIAKLVTDIQVENTNGGAIISYNAPDDVNLAYVLGTVVLNNGQERIVASSTHSNEIVIKGIGDMAEYDVKLYSVNYNEERSEEQLIKIKPLVSQVVKISNSIIAEPGFGGIKLKWNNEDREAIALIVEVDDTLSYGQVDTTFLLADITYDSSVDGLFAVRGFENVERSWRFKVRDRYDNFSPEIVTKITPLFEEAIPREDYEIVKLRHDAPSAWGWVESNLIDGNKGSGFHTPQGWKDPDGKVSEYEEENLHMFTIDLGVQAKLSRLKFEGRGEYYYKHGNPRIFDVWAGNTLNEDGSFKDWTKVITNGTVIKPSGLPLGQQTQEDIDFQKRGFDFEFTDAGVVPFRFIRFVNKENWAGTKFLHVMEIEFFGQIVE